MRIEHDAVLAAVKSRRLSSISVLQTGVGKDAILRTLDRALSARQTRPPIAVLLAGACGGLAPTHAVPPIAMIIDTHNHRWTPPLAADPAGVTLVAVDHVVATPEDKHALARSTGAAIVDMESHAFAARCESLSLPWGVIRGVSDTPDETLPSEVLRWISPEGNTRALRAAADLALKPTLIPHIAGVLKRSRRVLPMVGARVCDVAAPLLASHQNPLQAPLQAGASR
jgi:nucleoside phosphorylase